MYVSAPRAVLDIFSCGGRGVVPGHPDKKAIPWHSTPYQKLPEIHAQNASLEIAKVEVVTEKGSISGDRILAFKTQGFEGYDINCEKDWIYAEHLIKIGKVKLPKIKKQKKL